MSRRNKSNKAESSDSSAIHGQGLLPQTGYSGPQTPFGVRRFIDEDEVQTVVHVEDTSHQIGAVKKSEVYSRSTQFYFYWLNLPIYEPYLLTKKRYELLYEETTNWNIQNPLMPWFLKNPTLAILESNEEDQMESNPAGKVQWLLENNDMLCERLASFSVAFDTVSKLYLGSAANLSVLSRFRGDGAMMRVANACRFNVLNRRMNIFRNILCAPGAAEYVSRYSKVLTGTSLYGAPMYAFPLWITDPWGNRGYHEWDWKSFVNEIQGNPTIGASAPWQNYVVSSRGLKYSAERRMVTDLVRHSYGVLDQYAFGNGVHMTNTSGDPTGHASMPRIENGASYTYEYDGHTFRVPMNFDAACFTRTGDKHFENPIKWDKNPDPASNLIDKLYENLRFWGYILLDQFTALTKPETEMAKFFIEKGWAEQPLEFTDWWKTIVNSDYGDMASFSKNMVYKSPRKTTTSTVVKLDLPVQSETYYYKGKTYVGFMGDEDYFTRFELHKRHPLTEEMVNALRYPSLTPTLFFNSEPAVDSWPSGEVPIGMQGLYNNFAMYGEEPTVINAMPEWNGDRMPGGLPSQEDIDTGNIDGAENYGQQHQDMGKGAVMLDVAMATMYKSNESKLVIKGRDPKSVFDEISQYAPFVAQELPTKQWVPVQPLVDTTDPYQCGFNLWVSIDRLTDPDELTQWFTDHVAQVSGINDADAYSYVQGTFKASDKYYANQAGSVSLNDDGTEQVAPHVANATYLSRIVDALVFVGAMPFTSPQLALSNPAAAMPYQVINTGWKLGATDATVMPGYRELEDRIRALRTRKGTTYVVAPEDPDHPTDAALIIPKVSTGTQVAAGDVVAYAVNMIPDGWSGMWEAIQSGDTWKFIDHVLGALGMKEIVAPADGTWTAMKSGKRVDPGNAIGTITSDSYVSSDTPFGLTFLRNKQIRNDMLSAQELINIPAGLPVPAADLYDLLSNMLSWSSNVDLTSWGENIFCHMFDPAYGPVLILTKPVTDAGSFRPVNLLDLDDSGNTTDLEVQDDIWGGKEEVYPSGILPRNEDKYVNLDHYLEYAVHDGYEAVGSIYNGSHAWNNSIVFVDMDATVLDDSFRLSRAAPTTRYLSYHNEKEDMHLIDSLQATIQIGGKAYLPSITEAVKEVGVLNGDEGITDSKGDGVTKANVVAEPIKGKGNYNSRQNHTSFAAESHYRGKTSHGGNFMANQSRNGDQKQTAESELNGKRKSQKGSNVKHQISLSNEEDSRREPTPAPSSTPSMEGVASPTVRKEVVASLNKAGENIDKV